VPTEVPPPASLTAEDLKELGVSALGHRRILLDAAPCRSRPRVEQLWPREDPLVDLVVAECRLVFFETQAPQPDHNVHDGAYNQGWRASSAGAARVSRVAFGFSGLRKARCGLMAMARL